MSVPLGSIDLPDSTVIRGLDADTVAVSVERSDEGVAQVLVTSMEGGRALGLYGLFSIAIEEAVLALAASKTPVMLTHPRFSGMVLITGTSMEDWFEYVNPDPDDERVGTINVLEV